MFWKSLKNNATHANMKRKKSIVTIKFQFCKITIELEFTVKIGQQLVQQTSFHETPNNKNQQRHTNVIFRKPTKKA